MSGSGFGWYHGVCRDCRNFEDIYRNEGRARAATKAHDELDGHRAVYGRIA